MNSFFVNHPLTKAYDYYYSTSNSNSNSNIEQFSNNSNSNSNQYESYFLFFGVLIYFGIIYSSYKYRNKLNLGMVVAILEPYWYLKFFMIVYGYKSISKSK
jgi:hypothetical protein